ncbi:Hypothetical protein CpCP13_0920 [Corynebacterium pseudotuberculosis]|nr:Hypothetical protein CpVD57_0921 [Corynebacterium pseudotuberculosis]AKC73662.1 Hypothetical protein Cp226_0935 [Corynebacterium pseudotuberculosis]ANQ77091.1 Hypothetical protein CpCP13_0920 [Corynebacterium pseudotuberculosis]AQU92617.1 Hypothetical protein CpMIC6_0967 [Corynebacterium pseudotuberculosis]ATQ81189.1 Hypothetical protein CpPa08_0896 [Corynebacterium pseudotuberculosis]
MRPRRKLRDHRKNLGKIRVFLQNFPTEGIYLLNVKEPFPIRSLCEWANSNEFEIDVMIKGGISHLWVVG